MVGHLRISNVLEEISRPREIFLYKCTLHEVVILPTKKINSVALVRKLTITTERPPFVGVVPKFAGRECREVSATNTHGR
jgi:hypothetical protein